MMVIILLNVVIIYLMYFPALKDNLLLELIDQAFILIFLVEAIVKLSVLKPRHYFASSWNRFDFVIVVGSLPTLLINFIEVPDTSLLIILRLFRLIRILRFIRFVPNLGQVLEGLGRALRASVFVLVALLVLNLMTAIFTCHFYGEIAPELFGDPLLSIYSIFKLFTLEGWDDIPRFIASRTDLPWLVWVTRFYFVIVVLIGGIFGMSLANAVLIDEMTMDNNQELEKKIDDMHQELRLLREELQKRSR